MWILCLAALMGFSQIECEKNQTKISTNDSDQLVDTLFSFPELHQNQNTVELLHLRFSWFLKASRFSGSVLQGL